MMPISEYDTNYAARQLGRSRSPLRRLIKGFCLRDLMKYVVGPTIDFGCGAGQLLARLPENSIGLEVNGALVKALQSQGLNVQAYDPEQDQLRFSSLPADCYQTFVMSHVLEHFDDAADGLHKILRSCRRLGIHRVIVVVPSEKGYAFDKTHRSFINRAYLIQHNLLNCEGYVATQIQYFPLNIESIGAFFTFHELKVVYENG